jgi:parallel beta-helix repeat protein
MEEENSLKNRALALVIVAILLCHPIIITSSSVVMEMRKEDLMMTSSLQDTGTRLEPGEHVSHVPILIDEENDFVSQGWPGAGSKADPYVISALNITYDTDEELIRVFNIESHFIIQDCYFGQLSNDHAIRFENVTNAALEYITISSDLEGVSFNNVTNSTLLSSYVDVSGTDSAYIGNSHNVEIENNYMAGGRLYIWKCSGINAHNNEITSTVAQGARFYQSNGTLFNANTITNAGGVGLDVHNSSFCEIHGNHLEDSGAASLYLRLSENVSIIDNTILNAGSDAINYQTQEWISIVGNHISNSGGFPIYTTNSANGEILNNEIIGHTSNAAIVFQLQVENFTVSDNYIEDAWGGLFTQSGASVDCLHNTIIDVGNHFIAYQSIVDGSIVDNICEDTADLGVYISSSQRITASGNTISNGPNDGIYATGANHSIIGNTIWDTRRGVRGLIGAENVNITSNIIDSVDTGIQVNGEDATIKSNVITNSDVGIDLDSASQEAEVVDNLIEHSEDGIHIRNVNHSIIGNTIRYTDMAFIVDGATNPELEDNIIHNARYGVYVVGTTGGEFENNNLTQTGFFFETGQPIVNLNHSLIDNNVNNKPLFYALNQSGVSLNGNDYGEIILVNCSDFAIDGGEFTWSTVAFQVYYTNEVDISNIHIKDGYQPMNFYQTANVTITDSVIEGRTEFYAMRVRSADVFWVENVTFLNLEGNAVDIRSSTTIDVKYSWFENIGDSAIYMSDVANGVIEGNDISNATYGVYLDESVNNAMKSNHIRWTTYGIYSVVASDNNNASFNNIHDNEYGIKMDDSYSWYIYNNSIMWNSYGLYITTTNDDQWIYNNTFALNTLHNGYDDGADDWDDRVDGGNYWNDYGGTGVYNIPGGSSVDHFPMVYMITKPIINNPIDIWYAEGSEGNFITWVPFDDSLRDWVVEIDGATWASGVWNFQNINVSIDGLAYGTHTVFIEVWDVDQNSVNDTVIVHVYDDTPPEINSPPNTIAFEDGSGQHLTWMVSDLNPTTFVAYIDGEEYDTGTWLSGELDLDIDGLDAGEYVFKMAIQDVDGNIASDSIRVRVIDDNDAPELDSPADMIIVEGSSGNSIVWTPTDEYPDRYEIVSNDTIVREGDWGGGRIVLSLDDLEPGEYDFILTVYDGSGRTATDGVNVTVLPKGYTPQPPIDYLLLAAIGVVAGGIIVAVAIGLYLRKTRST